MRIPSGKVDQAIYFIALDSADGVTRKTGLTSFTVYRSRNGGAATLYTTPTVTEISAANMPGVYSLLIDEDTTIASTSDSEEYCVHITQASMLAVSRTIELYRRPVTTGNTLLVAASGALGTAAIAAATFAANAIDAGALAADAVTEIQAGLATAANLATVAGFIDTEIAAILTAAGTTLPAQIAALTIPTANANADALLDRASAVDTYTPRQAFRLMLALLTGEITFAGNIATIKAADGSKVRATFETNPQEERLNGVLDGT